MEAFYEPNTTSRKVKPGCRAGPHRGRISDGLRIYARTDAKYQVTSEVMKKAKGSSIILHSLPRRDELLPEVDDSRHARYWQEAYNGVVMRMALLSSVLGAWE